ncbi:MAG: hypothetical protein CL623_05865 [Arcobacter sp.]|nr:hypothetical protein [Arcobacter sp.]|tara:strand:- start:8023 stop:8598 length:576 start_codon:yes stop_codon:yes gene_type:complete
MEKEGEYQHKSIKHLMLTSFFNILEDEIKYVAEESNSTFIYKRWTERDYKSLNTRQLDFLKVLDLSFLNLNKIPQEIGCLENLEELNLAGNSLKELPEEIYNLKNLKVLILGDVISGGNNLTSLSRNIEKLTNLEVLKIVWNEDLKELPKEILKLPKLDLVLLSQRSILNNDVGQKLLMKCYIDIEDLYND